MERIEKAAVIEVPLKAVYDFLKEPLNLMRVWPNTMSVEPIDRRACGKCNFRWSRKLYNVRFEGTGLVEPESLRRVTCTIQGGLRMVLHWDLSPAGEDTAVKLAMSYDIPAPLHRRHPQAQLTRQMERDAEYMLAALTIEMEGRGESAETTADAPDVALVE